MKYKEFLNNGIINFCSIDENLHLLQRVVYKKILMPTNEFKTYEEHYYGKLPKIKKIICNFRRHRTAYMSVITNDNKTIYYDEELNIVYSNGHWL